MKRDVINEHPPKSMSGNEMMGKPNNHTSPGSIFICYRREDTADVTGRIYDRLIDHFGQERVFIDVEAIRLGYDFRSEIDQTIKDCSIVIVMIGDEWLAEVDGKRRIDDENDRVRIEIEAALRREIPIIPILARGASHPTKVMLPASLEALAYRHGTSIRHEHFRADVDFLISQMDKLLALRESALSKPAQSKEPQEREAEARSPAASVTLGETASQFPSRATPPKLDLGTERRQQDGVASAKDPTTPVKSAETTQLQAAIRPSTLIPAITDLQEPAVWTRKRLIIVAAVGVTVLLLLGITGQLSTPNSFRSAADLPQVQEELTDQQDAAAQNRLGLRYENGEGVTKDFGKAAELFQKAADQGNSEAQSNLGWLYENGNGVPKDLGKAAELYQKVADQGYAFGQTNLGVLYENGEGVTKDLGKAAELYQKAADQGYAYAQNNLGALYEHGEGVPMDFGKAEQLYRQAANQGNQTAIANLKRLSGH